MADYNRIKDAKVKQNAMKLAKGAEMMLIALANLEDITMRGDSTTAKKKVHALVTDLYDKIDDTTDNIISWCRDIETTK